MDLKLSIADWSAWSASRPGKEHWLAWAEGRKIDTLQREPDVSWVPAMKRRRMSSLSRMVFACASQCRCEAEQTPVCVFASRHGELRRTVGILQDIASGNGVSPTDFSLSVHNTALGLFSIFTGNRQPSSMVVAGEDTFPAAIIEAHTYLKRFPERQVLVVYADEPVPAPLKSEDMLPQEPICVALMLQQGMPENLAMSYRGNSGQISAGPGLAEAFLDFFLGNAPALEVMTRRACWRWTRL